MKKMFFSNAVLAVSLLTTLLIAATEVPFWISLFSVFTIFWRFAFEKYNVPKISKTLASIVAALIFLIVYLQYKSIFGQEESTAILIALASVSILNYETERDTYFLILLGFLLVALKSIFSLDFIWIVPAIIAFFGLWYSLISNMKINKIKFLFNLTLRAIPLFAILFIVFPRFVIFQTKKVQNQTTKSGFSEDLNPGQISELALQNQTVFTAQFENTIIESEQLYWRGAVLNESDGLIWKKGPAVKTFKKASPTKEPNLNYKIILDSFSLKNIFLLDVPQKIISSNVPFEQFENQIFYLTESTLQQVQIEAQSNLSKSLLDADDSLNKAKYLNYPELPRKTKALVDKIKLNNTTLSSRLDALKDFFARTDFVYTIKPDLYNNNLDDFLFRRKKGFCEHFAAAFATVARALDIPTRVVIGYQGGLYNSIGDFWKISQKDAHAWVEVALNGYWVRVDPTAIISPLRISMGADNFFSLSEEEQVFNSKNLSFKNENSFLQIMNHFSSFFDNLNYQWTLFLLDYDLQTQLSFLKSFRGGKNLSFTFILAILIFIFFNRHRKKVTTVKQHKLYPLISKIETWGSENGVAIKFSESPVHSLNLISEKHSELKNLLSEVSAEYERLVYKEELKNFDYKIFEKEWKQSIRNLKRNN